MPNTKTVSLVVLASMLLMALLAFGSLTVQAQDTAEVTVMSSMGGTTNPSAGTSTYNDGETITITATPNTPDYYFAHWILSTNEGSRTATDNPLSFPATGGENYEIQPVFEVITPIGVTTLPSDTSSFAIVVVLEAAGGTTDPVPGRYALADATDLNLMATPDSGWTFSHWIISGNTDVTHGGAPFTLEPTDNPYNVNHGYGETYYYQPVFTQSSDSPTPSPTIPEFSIPAIVLLLAAIVPVVILTRKNRKTK